MPCKKNVLLLLILLLTACAPATTTTPPLPTRQIAAHSLPTADWSGYKPSIEGLSVQRAVPALCCWASPRGDHTRRSPHHLERFRTDQPNMEIHRYGHCGQMVFYRKRPRSSIHRFMCALTKAWCIHRLYSVGAFALKDLVAYSVNLTAST